MDNTDATLAAHHRMFGRYNSWANGRLFAAASHRRRNWSSDRRLAAKTVA
jgi:hypothetical protein